LICESTVRRDLAKRQSGSQHEPLGAFDPAPRDVTVRRIPEAYAKYAAEMECAELNEFRELSGSDRNIEVGVDVCLEDSRLPWSESSSDDLLRPFRCNTAELGWTRSKTQRRCCTLETRLGGVGFLVQEAAERVEHLMDGLAQAVRRRRLARSTTNFEERTEPHRYGPRLERSCKRGVEAV